MFLFSAFLSSFLCSVSIASANLAIYFYLSVTYGLLDEHIAKYYEKLMHVIVLLSGLGIGIAMLSTQTGNPLGNLRMCSMDNYPIWCESIDRLDCKRGKNPVAANMIWYIYVVFTIYKYCYCIILYNPCLLDGPYNCITR